MSASASSNSAQTVINVVFGLSATIISVVTVWQGHRVWKMWREHARGQGNAAPDIELGLQSLPPTPTSAEAPDREEEEVATAGPLADHAGDVASSTHTLTSVQDLELQSTSTATTIHAETSLSPSPSPNLVQGAQTGNNERVEDYTQEAQPAITDTEPGELRPATNDGLGSGRGRK